MRQAVMTQPGQIEFRDAEKPAIANDQVLIQVKRIGICGSDIHVFHGRHPYTSYPIVQGHEVSGAIAEVDRDVAGASRPDVAPERHQWAPRRAPLPEAPQASNSSSISMSLGRGSPTTLV